MLNVEEAKTIMKWFNKFYSLNGIDTEAHEIRTVSMWDDGNMKATINNFMNNLNLGIVGINVSKKAFDETDLPARISESQKDC